MLHLSAFLLLILLLLSPAAVPAQALPPPPDKTISIDTSNADLQTVAAMLEQQTGIHAEVQPGSGPYLPVTVHLFGSSLARALRIAAFSAGAQVTQNAARTYVFTPNTSAKAQAQTSTSLQSQTISNTADLKWQRIALQHVSPSDILTRMHWGGSKNVGATSNLPGGVEVIFALQSNNSLLIHATDEGFEQVKRIISTLDIAPQHVQLKSLFAAIADNPKRVIDLTNPLGAMLQIHQVGTIFYQPLPMITNNNVDAAVALDMRLPRLDPNLKHWLLLNDPHYGGSTLSVVPALRLMPRINSDNSVTLSMNIEDPTLNLPTLFPDQSLTNTRTLKNGELTAYEITGMSGTIGYRVFLFVTPTILPASVDNGQGIMVNP
ncbi:MAG: hypothetical protein ACRYFS_02210 [Janthinobacterium lividum]